MAIVRLTRGLLPNFSQYPSPIGILGVVGRIHNYGIAQASTSTHTVRNYDETFGTLSCTPIIGGEGIKVTFVPNMPSNYRRYFAILRGRTEYKDNFNSTYKLIYEYNSFDPPTETIEVTDTDLETGVFYYYTALTLVGDINTPAHYEYNPNTCQAVSYAYKDFESIISLYQQLPERWRELDEDSLTYRFLQSFANVLDSLRTDVEAQMFVAKSIWESNEKNLDALAALIGWEVNREFNVDKQRKEVENAYAVYKSKGRHSAIQFLIQTITGWDSFIEDGYYRLIEEGDDDGRSVDWDDTLLLYRRSHPWVPFTEETIEFSGIVGETIPLSHRYVDRVEVYVNTGSPEDTDYWTQVEDFADYDSDDQVFKVNVDVDGFAEVEFGDGTNGSSPSLGYDITINYVYGGDLGKYAAEYPMSWLNTMGHRFVLTEADSTLDSNVLHKIFKAIEYFKASYAVYNVLLLMNDVTEVVPVPEDSEDSFEDTFTYWTFLRSNTLNHRSNTLGYFSAPL